MKKSIIKLAMLISIVGTMYVLIGPYMTLENIQRHQEEIHAYVAEHKVICAILFTLFYSITTSLSMPFIAILSLLAGFIFNIALGLPLVLISFFIHCVAMVSGIRFFFSKAIESFIKQYFGPIIDTVNRKMKRKGIYYVIFLRMNLVTPSCIINCACAFTAMNVWLFAIVSTISSIPILTFFVYSGKLLGSISAISDLYSKQSLTILISLAVMSAMPLLILKEESEKNEKTK